VIPTYFLYFFVDFFFSSRTSFCTRFNTGCEQMVRSIMLFAGWVTLLFTFGFFTFARSGEDSRSSPNEEGEIVFKSLENGKKICSPLLD